MKENKKLSISTKTEKEPEVVQGKNIGGGFDPKKEVISFYCDQRVKVVDGFYKGHRGKALGRRTIVICRKPLVIYQIELESMDIVECYGHELEPLNI